LLLVLASAVILGSQSCGTYELRNYSNLGDQVTIFISPRNRVTHLHLQALGSLSVAFYDSLGYGGGIRTCLHTGINSNSLLALII
jgi:hypothetical protein